MRAVTRIEELRALVGQELGVGPWLVMTQDRVNAFAEVTGDDQFIHVDPVRAAKTQFGGTIVHGFLTLSLLPLLARGREGIAIDLNPAIAVNYGLNKVRFVLPVRVGRSVRLRTDLLSVEDVSPRVYQVIYRQTVEVAGEQKPAMVAESITRLYL